MDYVIQLQFYARSNKNKKKKMVFSEVPESPQFQFSEHQALENVKTCCFSSRSSEVAGFPVTLLVMLLNFKAAVRLRRGDKNQGTEISSHKV